MPLWARDRADERKVGVEHAWAGWHAGQMQRKLSIGLIFGATVLGVISLVKAISSDDPSFHPWLFVMAMVLIVLGQVALLRKQG